MNLHFWAGKRVLITGHTGFKGSWLSLWLQLLGAKVIGYALKPTSNPNLFEDANIADGMLSFYGNVLDFDFLQKIIQEHNPEIVFHLAAQPLVRDSYLNPVNTYATNVMGTVHLLEAIRNTPGIKAVVNVTTDKFYENKEWFWGYRENDRLGGFDPYSNSKACSELVSAAYRSSFFKSDEYLQHGVALATARAGNVIGGGDYAKDRLIPDIISAFESKTDVDIRNPNAVRPWQYVLEPLRGYCVLAQKLYEQGDAFAQAWNFGPNYDDTKTVAWIVQKVVDTWAQGIKWRINNQKHSKETSQLRLDIAKSACDLNWRPILNLEQALQLTINWYKQRQSGVNARFLLEQDLAEYMRLIGYKKLNSQEESLID